jgi:hypothetical protein
VPIFKVRWKDYTAAYDTWEPEESFVEKEVLNKYLTSIGGREALDKSRKAPEKAKVKVSG